MDDQQGSAISGATIRHRQTSRRGCEGVISINEITNREKSIEYYNTNRTLSLLA